jgi:hypothetical protein
VYLLVFHAYINEIHGSRSKIPSKITRPYIYEVKFLALLGAPYIYDVSRLRVNRRLLDIKRKVSQVFNNSPQGSRLRGRPIGRWWSSVKTVLIQVKLQIEKLVINKSDWERSIKEAKVRIGM